MQGATNPGTGYASHNPNVEGQHFDYLTNPGGKPQQEEEENQEETVPQEETVDPTRTYNINEGLEKMERHYENNLKRKFERR